MSTIHQSPKKILILGSGALKIGEAGEFDYSGSQAIKAVKEEGIPVVLVNPNIATIQTSKELAQQIYFLPIEPWFVEKVIIREKPDGILLSFGGQTALNCGLALAKEGILQRYGVAVLGTPIEAIKKTEDRALFKHELEKLTLKTPESYAVNSISQGKKVASEIGFPLMLRGGFTLGGLGSTVVYRKENLVESLSLALSGSQQVLVEEYLYGWKEIEYEVIRDRVGNTITVCNMENMDPMGIHTGESIVVAPSQTLTNSEYQFMRNQAISVAKALAIVGECNIQFAISPATSDYRIIEVNARLSRSSALASKATGYPLAYVATKLALGYRLDEIPNSVTKVTSAFYEPALDYIVVKIPRWDLEKFKLANMTIGTEMKSVGEVMSIGRTFEEAIQKAARMLDQGHEGIIDEKIKTKKIRDDLKNPSPPRLFYITQALQEGLTIKDIAGLTGIDPWFIERLAKIVKFYQIFKKRSKLTAASISKAKKLGFSDNHISQLFATSLDRIRFLRKKYAIVPRVKSIDTLAGEFPAQTNYFYFTYHGKESDMRKWDEKKAGIIILGSGPYGIGSSVEFDWCAMNTVLGLKKRGFKSIMVNCNPETVSTDYDYADTLYFEEITGERLLDIWDIEKPKAVVLSVGGQIPNNLASFCRDHKLQLLGTQANSILAAEDRHDFSCLLENLEVSQPPWKELTNKKQALMFAHSVGYPILVRPSFVLSGTAMSVLYTDKDVTSYLKNGSIANSKKFVVSKFIEGAREIDVDAVAQNGRIIVRAISEHVERAGVHSGDSTLVLPPFRLGNEIITEVDQISQKIARALKISGPFNIQFLERMDHIMAIECNLRASRSFPFVSKVLGINFMDIAVSAMLGEKKMRFSLPDLAHVGVKAAQFSFNRIKGADPVLRVEMTSTGEVATLGGNIYDAYLKSLMAVGMKPPKKNIFLSIGDWENKEAFFPYAKILFEMGFKLYATENTHKFLAERGIESFRVNKMYEGKKNTVVDFLKQGKIDLVINITEPPARQDLQVNAGKAKGVKEEERFKKRLTDGYLIRRTSVDYHVPLLTNLESAMLFVRSLKECQFSDLEVLPWNAYI